MNCVMWIRLRAKEAFRTLTFALAFSKALCYLIAIGF